jgi:ATP-dependent RNA helicase SUPV3L1/SUV3
MSKHKLNLPGLFNSRSPYSREAERAEKVELLLGGMPGISPEEREYLRRTCDSVKLETITPEFLCSRLAAKRWRELCSRHPLPSLEEKIVRGRTIGRRLTYPAEPPMGFALCSPDGNSPLAAELEAALQDWISKERDVAEAWIRQTAEETEIAAREVEELAEAGELPLLLEKSKLIISSWVKSGDLSLLPAAAGRISQFFRGTDETAWTLRSHVRTILSLAHPWMLEATAHSLAQILANANPTRLPGQLDHLEKIVVRLSGLVQQTAQLCEKTQNQKIPPYVQDLFRGDCRMGLREKKLAQGLKEHLTRVRKEFLEYAREKISELLTATQPDIKVKSDSRTTLTLEHPVEFKEKLQGVELIFNFPAKTRIDISKADEKEDLRDYLPLAEKLLREAAATVQHKGKHFLSRVRPHFANALQLPGVDPSDFKHLFAEKPWLLGSMALETLIETIDEIVQKAQEREAMSRILTEHNLDRYREFFPVARRLGQRKLIFLAGPTNSGKTYHGLNLLASFESGVYLAPLRLLALEGQEELFKRGVKASFLTGEERDIVPEARFTASTIEMLNLHQVVEAALIDEIQLLADRGRGWAWTQAFVGVPARTVILTGSANAIPLVRRLAEYTGEEVEVRQFSRLTPLEPLLAPQSIDRPEPGTAFIAFSRRDVLELREHLRTSGIAASVIYGNLSPDVRREEARRFRSGETRIVVATDAIGMGLNLPIQKVVFYTLTKFDGRDPRPLTDAELLQIAGRAGRYQQYPIGFAGALEAEDARRVAQALRSGTLAPPREKVFVQPTADFVLALREFLPEASFLDTLLLFRSKMRFDNSFIIPVVTDDMFELARIVDAQAARKRAYRDQVEELFQWICAPVDTKTSEMVTAYQDCLHHFLANDPVHPRKIVKLGGQISNNYDLLQAEIAVKILTLYCWLGYRYDNIFPDLEDAEEMRGIANRSIEKALLHKKLTRVCNDCGKPLPPLFQFPICDRCYRSRNFRWEGPKKE